MFETTRKIRRPQVARRPWRVTDDRPAPVYVRHTTPRTSL